MGQPVSLAIGESFTLVSVGFHRVLVAYDYGRYQMADSAGR